MNLNLVVALVILVVVLIEIECIPLNTTPTPTTNDTVVIVDGLAKKVVNSSLAQALRLRKKRQGYYNLGNTDYRPSEYNDGISNYQLSNPLSPAHQYGNNQFGGFGGVDQVATGWVGHQFQGDVGQSGANIVESGGGGSDAYYQTSTSATNGNANTTNVNGYINGNGNGNGNGGYNPFANVAPGLPGGQQQNYLQMNYGVQGNLYNPLLHSIYGYQYQQKQPFVSEQENQFGKPQNQLENQQQLINNPNLFGGYGEYNSPLTFQQIYGPYLNTVGYNPTTTTTTTTTTLPPRVKYSKSFNPYEDMTTRRLPVTPQVLWYSRYVDLTAPIAAVPFSNYNNI